MQRFPQDLIDAFNSYEVVGIIGSGPSAAAGFPNWSQLLDLMVTECEQQLVGFKQGKELRNLIKNGHLLEVADECSRLLEGQLYRDFIQRVFRQKLIRPVRLHELIVQLPFSSLLTTNYDNLLERACVARPRSDMYPLVFTLKNAAQLPRLASERRFFIFKIHGDADDVESIVLTKRDYREIIHNNEVYRTALSQILATHTVLFVGYGLRDHDLNLILGEQAALFKAYGRRHYAFLADPGTILPKSFLEHYNVTVIPYTRKKYHGELERLLETLLKHVKTVPVADEKDETRKLKQLIEIEREFCKKLGTFIEPERARFLKLHAAESLEPRDRQLVEESIQYWDSREMAHKDLEFQLRQSQRMEAIGLLSAGIAHDFNNILMVIRGYAMLLLQQGRLTAELEDHVRQIDSATEQAVNLVRQLLTFARKQVTYRVPMNLNEIVESLLRILRRTIGENISLKMDLQHDLTLVEADASMIEQVIMNLAVNARDAMPNAGELIIQTKTSIITDEYLTKNPEARIGTFVCLSVTDTGCGIPQEILGRIFEPFFKTKEAGTGLGLSTVYGIIKQHEGWIEVKSEVGKGSSFQVFLPESKQPLRAAIPTREIKDLHGKEMILLVEDEPAVRLLISKGLQNFDYRVIEASNGPEAVRIWKERSKEIDLLLTDMVMPEGITGYELSLLLLKDKPSLRVIYMTGYGMERLAVQGLPKDLKLAEAFLQKPITVQTLLSTIRSVLDTGKSFGS